jgi:lipopolysaccharide export system protein LptC
MTRNNILITLILILLVGLTGWLQNAVEVEEPKEKRHHKEGSPDYYMEDFTIIMMDEVGKPKQRLVSDKMLHFPHDDSTELTKPRLKVFKENSEPWYISANRGLISSDGDLILLKGDVVLDRPAETKLDALRLTTTELHIRPKDQYAETDKPVLLTGRGNKTSAVGMRVYLKQGKMHLLSRVRGTYD